METKKPTTFKKIEENILLASYPSETVLDLRQAKAFVAARKEFTQNKPVALLLDIRNLKSASKEAREYSISPESIENISAGAFFSPLIFHKIMFYIFITFSHPKVPTKLFRTKKAALNWLRKMNKNNL